MDDGFLSDANGIIKPDPDSKPSHNDLFQTELGPHRVRHAWSVGRTKQTQRVSRLSDTVRLAAMGTQAGFLVRSTAWPSRIDIGPILG